MPDVPAAGLSRGCSSRRELLVPDHLRGLLERRQIVAAVVNERRGILKDDLVVVRKSVRRDEVAPADLDPVDAELLRREVEQPLDDEHAVLPAGAAHRRHDRLVREDRRELALVVRDVVRTEQRALAVDRNRQAVRIVGARVVEEDVVDAEDAPVLRERHLGVVHLAPLLRRRVEVLLPVLGPLERPVRGASPPTAASSSSG